MAIEDFPFVQFITKEDDIIIGLDKDNDFIIAEARELISWSPSDCDCDNCLFSENALSLLDEGNFRRINFMGTPLHIVVLGDTLSDEQIQEPIADFVRKVNFSRSIANIFS